MADAGMKLAERAPNYTLQARGWLKRGVEDCRNAERNLDGVLLQRQDGPGWCNHLYQR
jgi:hypothetical protein